VRILLWHGYLLRDFGSNIYTANLASQLRKLGHNVLLLCQERDPSGLDFIDEIGDLRPERYPFADPPSKTGLCRVARPWIADLLPVYVYDEYPGFRVKTFPDLSDSELDRYTSLNIGALVTAIEAHRPDECAVDSAEPAVITLTQDTWNTIVSVNRNVNRRIKPVTDKVHWGLVDRWEFPDDGMGDCEDFQLLKRKLLVERGLPRRALRMTVVIDEIGEGHAVLMVRTDRGDFILDNKIQAVVPWNQTGYVFVKREGQNGAAWVALGNLASPTTTANR
jgi:predicted transglutaminase-like cysteine proteinase